MKTLNELRFNSEEQFEEARLTASKLLNVEGGVDTDEDDCLNYQCASGAEIKYCFSNA
jgi:hypothetical protein